MKVSDVVFMRAGIRFIEALHEGNIKAVSGEELVLSPALTAKIDQLGAQITAVENSVDGTGMTVHIKELKLDTAADAIVSLSLVVGGMHYAKAKLGKLEASDRFEGLVASLDSVSRKALKDDYSLDWEDVKVWMRRMVYSLAIYRNAFYMIRDAIRSMIP